MYKGKLTTWKDDRGFGFIKPSNGSKEVFLHISALQKAGRRPRVGDTISYELKTEVNGKVSAFNASIEGVTSQPSPHKQKRKKQVLHQIFISTISLAGIAIFATQFSSSRYPSPVTSITKPGCKIKGNISINTGRKVYHVPGAEDYESTVINPSSGERWFCTESEAIANGWQKSPR